MSATLTSGLERVQGRGRETGGRRCGAGRRAVLGGALALVGSAAAACAGPGAPGAAPPAPGGAQGKLTWLVRTQALENPWEQDVVLPAMRERIPGLEIDLQVTADVWNEKVFAMHAGGTPPDVHNGIVGTFIQLYAQDQLLELTPLLARDRVDLRPFGGFEKDPDMCRGGKTWSLPVLTTLGNMTFYNADLLEQAGVPAPPTSWQDRTWNWDRVLEIAR
ncbi:MAG TPA: extracellular solute-binding protein, partial [Chloroflexota bacterium]|nr:extracellular solute-binding protein [Chloroflexota bacterium]